MRRTDDYANRTIKHSLMWVNGYPKHNCIDDECVPDFSCCNPDCFEQDKKKRIKSHEDLLKKLGRSVSKNEKSSQPNSV